MPDDAGHVMALLPDSGAGFLTGVDDVEGRSVGWDVQR